jgi:tRNA (cytidine56-2'-O)-methyltransferase
LICLKLRTAFPHCYGQLFCFPTYIKLTRVNEIMIAVLRWGHRAVRDERITSHVCLVARAFGAGKVIISGENAGESVETTKKIAKNWGGKFEVEYTKNWRKVLSEWEGKIVHLTMYGERVQDKIDEIKEIGGQKDLLVVVGSQKVPGELYSRASYNIAVTSQPHSEVAALAIFLHEYFGGKELDLEFPNAKVKIKPNAKGKSFF